MKNIIFYLLALGLISGITIPASGQTDTLTKPGRINNFQDPKITDDNSKVLLDSSNNIADSLLDAKKRRKNPISDPKKNPLRETDKPVKIKRAPVDSGRTVRP